MSRLSRSGPCFPLPRWVVMLMTSFLFGAIHLEPRQGLWAMFFGLAIYAVYVATRSLWAAIFVHFANNGLAVIHTNEWLGLPVLAPIEEPYKDGPIGRVILFTVAALFLFSAVAYALYQTRCKLASIAPDLPTWEPPGVSSVELPPKASGTIVTHAPLSATSAGLVLAAAVAFALVIALA